MFKQRFTSVSGSCDGILRCAYDQATLWSASYSGSAYSDYESITTMSGRRHDNPCEHRSYSSERDFDVTGWNGTYHVHNSTGYKVLGGYYHAGWNPNFPVGLTFPTLNQLGFSDFTYDAYRIIRPTMTRNASLLNFLWEGREFSSMFRLWNRYATRIQNVAGAHLNYQFGWKPFLDDIVKLCRLTRDFEKAFTQFVQRAGSMQERRYLRPIKAQQLVTDSESSSHRFRVTHDITGDSYFGCKMNYVYQLPPYSLSSLRALAFLDHLGANITPQKIWAAIPWSWLSDWVVRIGPWLEQFSRGITDPDLSIQSCLYSAKITGTMTTEVDPWSINPGPWWTPPGNGYQVAVRHKYKYYTRFFGLPDTASDLEIGNIPGWGRVSIGTSLIITRR